MIVRGTPAITISDYQVGQASLTYETPAVANSELNIDQAKSWAFKVDDIDEMASDMDLMNKFTAAAGEELKVKIDADCLQYISTRANASNIGNSAGAISGGIAMGATGSPVTIDANNAVNKIVDVNVVLDEQAIPSENRFIVVPAWFVGFLKKSDLKSANVTNDSTGVIRSGVIGMVK